MTPDPAAVPDGWQEVRLGDVAAVNQGLWDPADGSAILYLDLTSVVEPGRLSAPVKMPAEAAPSRARRRVRTGDILVSTVRPYLRGFARVREAPKNLIASTGFAVLTPQAVTDGSLLYHHVMSPSFARHLEANMTGQAYPAVRPDDVAAYPLSLPPLAEQRAIATVLDTIDEAIERTEEVIAATGRLRDALLHELLTRGLPGRHSEWADVPGLGTVPACWDVVRLGDVATVRNGTTPSRSRVEYWEGGDVPFVKTGRVNDVSIEQPDEFITSRAVESAGAVIVPAGSVLIAMIGQGKTRGKTARLRFDAAINQNFGAIYDTADELSLEFVFLWARHNYPAIRNLGQGTNQDALNCDLIESLRLPRPPVAEQDEIADSVSAISEREAVEGQLLRELRHAKAATADALLTGRVRVRLDVSV